MNVLKKCCYRSLKENPKRTVVTIIGIVLATSLITAVSCMVVSFRASMIAYEKQHSGDYHYYFAGVDTQYLKYFENNQNIEKCSFVEEIGYAVLEGSQNPDKPYLYISAIDETAEEALALHLVEGRMPADDSELVIGGHIRSNALVDMKVGDTLVLRIGDRMSEGYRLSQENSYLYGEEALETYIEKTYTVVGIIERPKLDVEPRMGPGYSVYTRMENPREAQVLDIYVSYTKSGLRRAEQVTAGLLGVPEELYRRYYGMGSCTEEEIQQLQTVAGYVSENYWLLKWELLIFSSNTMRMLYAMSAIAVVIIIVTSVFCIHNSFVISLTEKMKLYGRLSSVGTTSGQQRKIVYYEAAFLGLAGIPLGVVCGIGATAILVKIVGGNVEDAIGIPLKFGISIRAVLVAVLLSGITILFSASKSARRAARISPISAIRSNDTVKISRRELRCPGMIGRLFGIGGRIAYKNLRRARVKYRTTVVSIVVSVAVFIGMSTFVNLMSLASGVYYESVPYQLRVDVWNGNYESAVWMTKVEGVLEAEIIRRAGFVPDRTQIPYTELGQHVNPGEGMIMVRTLGEEAYARYCKRLGVSVEEAEDKAIVLAYYKDEYVEDGKIYVEEGEMADFHPGDVIREVNADATPIEIEVLMQTRERPMSMENRYYSNDIEIIVSDAWMDSHPLTGFDNIIEVDMKCENTDKVEEIIRREMPLQEYVVVNYEAQYRSEKSTQLVISVFLYGFITVVALIGITNIFNTITTNMELRAPEFAMLKSVGMTHREFRRMIWLEGFFYGGKALIIGIPVGVLLSFCFHMALGEGIVVNFQFPWSATLCSIAAVVALLFGIMHYSMGKINRKNIIETIQNENI